VRRGEIRVHAPLVPRPGLAPLRLVVSADELNGAPLPFAVALHVVAEDPRIPRFSVGLGRFGWAIATTVESTLRSRLGYVVGTATAEEMEQVAIALRVALDLD
jgi:mRNA-degrading endonuclease toxin of MazEF toxin-antitoxin module